MKKDLRKVQGVRMADSEKIMGDSKSEKVFNLLSPNIERILIQKE